MAFSQFGTNSAARKKRVYYIDSSTIYEGMPVCYDYDATANVLHYDKGAGGDVTSQTSPTTTAEGNQNEGKFLRVEDPTDNNLQHFAGVVAGNSYAGLVGPRWLDIYIPNGAIVPVRCDVDTTTGQTVLAITVDQQELGVPIWNSRVVAIAMETETALDDGTPGITLARLDPTLFVYQDLDGTALIMGGGAASLTANKIHLSSTNTSSRLCALWIRSKAGGASGSGGAGIGMGTDVGCELSGTHTVAYGSGGCSGLAAFLTAKTGATLLGVYGVLYLKCENQDGTPATVAGASIYSILFDAQLNTNSPTDFAWWNFRNNGTAQLDGMFSAYTYKSIPMAVKSSASVSHVIPFKIKQSDGAIAAGTYYLMVSSAA